MGKMATFTLKADGELVERLGEFDVLTKDGPVNLGAFCGMCRGRQVKLTMAVTVDEWLLDRLQGLLVQTNPPEAVEPKVKQPEVAMEDELAAQGIVAKVAEGLVAAGYTSLELVADATVEELLEVKGVGQATAPKLRKLAKKLTK